MSAPLTKAERARWQAWAEKYRGVSQTADFFLCYEATIVAVESQRDAAREAAAGVCENRARSLRESHDHHAANEAQKCAMAIRAKLDNGSTVPVRPAAAQESERRSCGCVANDAWLCASRRRLSTVSCGCGTCHPRPTVQP